MTIEEKTIQDEIDRTIEIKGTLRVEDYLSKLDIFWQRVAYLLIELISISIVIYCFKSHLYIILLEYPIVIIAFTIIILLLLILGTWCYGKMLPRKTKKRFKKSNIRNEHIYTINSETITREIKGTILHLNWSDATIYKEDKDIFYINVCNKFPNLLYIPKNKFSNLSDDLKLDKFEKNLTLRIPKRFFQSESDIIYFKELLQKNVPLNRKCYKSN